MVDPLAEVVTLLQPRARFSKLVEGGGRWRMRREGSGEPYYCAVLEGACHMSLDGQPAVTLQAGDFLLTPALHEVTNTSIDPPDSEGTEPPTALGDGHFRLGDADAPVNLRLRVGHCSFAADAALLVPLLPQHILVRGQPRLAALVEMVGEETRAQRPARELVLERLLEVLLIEALRSGDRSTSAPSLARGLTDERLAVALRALHAQPERSWTVAAMAQLAALSRSAFFSRFQQTVGLAPMAYLLTWRMALAKRLLVERELSVEQVAERVGYRSASTFSVAFSRHAGLPPTHYARGVALT